MYRSPQDATVQNFLATARLINSDTKRNIKCSQFTSALTGKFYQNNSLLAHGTKLSKVHYTQERKQQLLEAIYVENEKLKMLEIKLREQKSRRREELETHRRHVQTCLTCAQSHVRRRRACAIVDKRRIEYKAICCMALFCQTRMRGYRDRRLAALLKQEAERKRQAQEYGSIRLQSYQRRRTAVTILTQLKLDRQLQQCQAATKIQSHRRALKCKKERLEKLLRIQQERRKTNAALCIQCYARKYLSKAILRQKQEEEFRSKQQSLHRTPPPKQKTVSPPKLVEEPKRPFAVGKPRRQSIASLVRVVKSRNKLNGGASEETTVSSLPKTSPLISEDHCTELDSVSSLRRTEFQSAHYIESIAQQPFNDDSVAHADEGKAESARLKAESARLKAAARAAFVNRRRRKMKENEQAPARVAAERAIALELKRKQLLRAKAKAKAKATAPAARKNSTSRKSLADDDTTKSEVKLDLHERGILSSTNEFQQEIALETVHPSSPKLSSAKHPGFFAPRFDVTFDEHFDENEDDIGMD